MEKKKAPLEIQKQTVWFARCCLLSVILSDHIIRSFNVFEFSKVMQNFCGSTVSQQFTKHRALEAPRHLEPLVATRCWDCAIALYLYMRLSQYSNDGGDGSFLLISTHLLAQILVCPFLALHSYTSKLCCCWQGPAFHIENHIFGTCNFTSKSCKGLLQLAIREPSHRSMKRTPATTLRLRSVRWW